MAKCQCVKRGQCQHASKSSMARAVFSVARASEFSVAKASVSSVSSVTRCRRVQSDSVGAKCRCVSGGGARSYAQARTT